MRLIYAADGYAAFRYGGWGWPGGCASYAADADALQLDGNGQGMRHRAVRVDWLYGWCTTFVLVAAPWQCW
jgi:hypothetical protein